MSAAAAAAAGARRQEYKEQTRAAVLDAAAQQFAVRGYAATTIDDIARAARVSKGAVYYHVPDKAALFELVLRERIGRLRERIDAASARRQDPWDRLIAAIAVQVDGTIADEQLRALIEQAPVALGIPRRRELDRELSLAPLLSALQELEAGDRLAQPASELVAEVLLRAINEAALAAAAAADVPAARREAASTVTAMARGLRRAPRMPQADTDV